jgi:hypothetical protein
VADPDLPRSEPADGNCNETDGFSVCTELPGHSPVHWDRCTQHEWFDDECPVSEPKSWQPRDRVTVLQESREAETP